MLPSLFRGGPAGEKVGGAALDLTCLALSAPLSFILQMVRPPIHNTVSKQYRVLRSTAHKQLSSPSSLTRTQHMFAHMLRLHGALPPVLGALPAARPAHGVAAPRRVVCESSPGPQGEAGPSQPSPAPQPGPPRPAGRPAPPQAASDIKVSWEGPPPAQKRLLRGLSFPRVCRRGARGRGQQLPRTICTRLVTPRRPRLDAAGCRCSGWSGWVRSRGAAWPRSTAGRQTTPTTGGEQSLCPPISHFFPLREAAALWPTPRRRGCACASQAPASPPCPFPPPCARRVALLVGGDAAALLLFAAIGRMNHGEGMALGDLLTTAAPFLLGARVHGRQQAAGSGQRAAGATRPQEPPGPRSHTPGHWRSSACVCAWALSSALNRAPARSPRSYPTLTQAGTAQRPGWAATAVLRRAAAWAQRPARPQSAGPWASRWACCSAPSPGDTSLRRPSS